MSRVNNATKNIFFGYIGNIVTIIISFISRTAFIYTLGATYLGVNGLYTNVLSVLSLAELGIGTAMNYSLYKPIADKDHERIKSLMNVYKKAYTSIAIIVSVMGLILVPFLKYIIKDPGSIGINDLRIYYLIFLFNTVTTYFIAYKYSLVNAEQKSYIQTNINAMTTLITSIFQIIILYVFKSFLLYLLTSAVIGLIQKIYVNKYLNELYPYLLDKDIEDLPEVESIIIKRNIKALIFHKIGDVSVHQTDNILISSFINVTTVGLVSNYNLIITSITGFTNIIFNSVVSGFGNLIATEKVDKQYFIFKVYRFLGFWIYGFSSIAFIILLTPFIELWIGKTMVIENVVIYLVIINYYFTGHRIVINNFKTASGIFDADKYISIIQAVVNLVVSIILVRRIGLTGIYIGTICSGLISSFTRPFIVYKAVFNKSAYEYYKDSIIYIIVISFSLITLEIIKRRLIIGNSVISFIIMTVLVVSIPNIIFYIFFRNREEFNYLVELIKTKIFRRKE